MLKESSYVKVAHVFFAKIKSANLTSSRAELEIDV